MNTIELTEALHNDGKIKMNAVSTPMHLGHLQFNVCNEPIILSSVHQDQIRTIIGKSMMQFVRCEDTLAIQKIGRPTLIARLDATLSRGSVYSI